MGMLYEFNDLKNLLSMRGVESEKDIEQRFSDIAEVLLNKTAIRKGERLYFLTDIEFYWFSKNHKDTITYPRNCNAGDWFFHNSGVDIAFDSYVSTSVRNGKRRPILDGTERFGGILIRGMKPETNWFTDGEVKTFDGPYKAVDELFDQFSAIETPSDFPILVPYNHSGNIQTSPRTNLLVRKTAEDKVSGILGDNYYDAEQHLQELTDSFNLYLSKPYRYYL
jgi:hypothetical protein